MACVLACVFVAGCGQSGGDDSQQKVEELEEQIAELEAAKEEVPTTERAASTTTAPPSTAPPTTAAPTTAPPTTPPPASIMPDVVCMNLQAAQDHIQEVTDVFYSRSEDATGQGRSQIVDSNWIVVGQTPEAGTPIGEGDAVLSVVKTDEPNPC